jgi:hypothetical protein
LGDVPLYMPPSSFFNSQIHFFTTEHNNTTYHHRSVLRPSRTDLRSSTYITPFLFCRRNHHRNWHSILCRPDRQSYTWQSLLQYLARQQRLHIFMRETFTSLGGDDDDDEEAEAPPAAARAAAAAATEAPSNSTGPLFDDESEPRRIGGSSGLPRGTGWL